MSEGKVRDTIFVDESGSPDFRATGESAYVTCAVVVPPQSRDEVDRLLPRDARGKRLKASETGFGEADVIHFIQGLVTTAADVALVLVCPSGEESVGIAVEATEIANAGRAREKRRLIKPAHLMYALLAFEAVANAWSLASKRRRSILRECDLTFDRGGLPRKYQEEVEGKLRELAAKRELVFHAMDWGAEEEKPLLLVPDLLAGLTRRRFTGEGYREAWEVLWREHEKGRIWIQDGKDIVSLPPKQKS